MSKSDIKIIEEALRNACGWVSTDPEHKQYSEALTAVQRIKDGGWRSMETAPKDGTPILVSQYSSGKEYAGMHVCSWSEFCDEGYKTEGHWQVQGKQQCLRLDYFHSDLSEWMPLPTPSKITGGSDGK